MFHYAMGLEIIVGMTVHQAIRNRRSVRAYSPKPIPDDVLQRMKDALRLAPSACNIQPWKFILVTDAKLRQGLARRPRDRCGWPTPR